MNKRRVVTCGSVVLVLACGLFAVSHQGGCFNDWQTVAIADLSQPTSLTLRTSAGDGFPMGHPSGVSVRVTVEIGGEAEVSIAGWPPERLSGRVEWERYGDWFKDECPVEYRPHGTVSGSLTIRYKFH